MIRDWLLFARFLQSFIAWLVYHAWRRFRDYAGTALRRGSGGLAAAASRLVDALAVALEQHGTTAETACGRFSVTIAVAVVAVGVLADGLLVDEVGGAQFAPRCVLVGHARLHDLLQALALHLQLVHRVVLFLKSLLEVVHHPLFDLL